MKEQRAPDDAPYHGDGTVGISKGERHALDDLLPPDGVNPQDRDHAAVAQHEPQA